MTLHKTVVYKGTVRANVSFDCGHVLRSEVVSSDPFTLFGGGKLYR